VANGAAATAKVASIALGTGGTRTYAYDEAGNTIQVVDPAQQLDLLYDASNRLSRLRTVPTQASSDLAYDIRGFLAITQADDNACAPTRTAPVYSSDGRLHRWAHLDPAIPGANPFTISDVLYFAGRPVALYGERGATSLTYLTTDHFGTPTIATRDNGTVLWQGGLEPFGRDWNGAQAAAVCLRFPGQWLDNGWNISPSQDGLYYNLNRWFDEGTGKFLSPDPVGLAGDENLLSYARSNPAN
jgi:RHS repeat-associated protein